MHLVWLNKVLREFSYLTSCRNENLIKKMCLKGIKKRDDGVICIIGPNHLKIVRFIKTFDCLAGWTSIFNFLLLVTIETCM